MKYSFFQSLKAQDEITAELQSFYTAGDNHRPKTYSPNAAKNENNLFGLDASMFFQRFH